MSKCICGCVCVCVYVCVCMHVCVCLPACMYCLSVCVLSAYETVFCLLEKNRYMCLLRQVFALFVVFLSIILCI